MLARSCVPLKRSELVGYSCWRAASNFVMVAFAPVTLLIFTNTLTVPAVKVARMLMMLMTISSSIRVKAWNRVRLMALRMEVKRLWQQA